MLSSKLSTKRSSNTNCRPSPAVTLSSPHLSFRYPNADELRSIVSRLVDRHPPCVSVIGSVDLLVRKLYYKFCNERKKYPIELKRRQPNKRKRSLRDESLDTDWHHSSLDHLMHLWTSPSDSSDEIEPEHEAREKKSHPLNLSTCTALNE